MEIIYWSGKNKIDFFKNILLKDKDMDNKMSNISKFYKVFKKQNNVNKKNNKKQKLTKKEKFMNLKGYRIKVGEDTYILFKNEAFYLQLLYLEKVYFDIHKQLFNNKEVISLIFRLKTLKTYLEYFRKYYNAIKITVYYDRRKYENPLKFKFPNLSCCEDYNMGKEIVDEIINLENEQLEDAYFDVKHLVNDTIDVRHIIKNEYGKFIYPDSDQNDEALSDEHAEALTDYHYLAYLDEAEAEAEVEVDYIYI